MRLRKSHLLFCVSLVLSAGLFFSDAGKSTNNVQAAGVAAPTFNKKSGCYDDGFLLELKAAEGNKIYYTTDGSIPEVPDNSSSGSGTEPSETVYEIPAKVENVYTPFTDQTTAQNVSDGVKLDFAYRYKSISFSVPAGKQDWSKASKLVVEYTVNNYRNGYDFQLQICPVFAGATSSYQEPNGASTRAFDAQGISVSGTDRKTYEINLSSYYNLSNIGYLMIGNATNNPNDNVNANKDSVTIHSMKVVFGNNSSGSVIPKKETAKEYTGEILVKNRQGEENVLCSAENINVMQDNSFYPDKESVAKATVIRAVAVDGAGNRSTVITRTYFVGNDIYNKYKNASVISMVTDPDNLLNEQTGIYRIGNYQNKGSEWERDAFVEYFEEDGTIPFATTMGIRIHGGYSRNYGQKSFNLYFREELGGLKNLKDYNLIPGNTNFEKTQPINKYKHFMLRNGGNDTEYTKLQDVFIQSLVTDRAFTTQSSRPCILFLNGEYWGLYSLQEKYSDNYIEEKFGIDKDNVIVVKNGQLDEGVDDDMQYYYQMRSLSSVNMKDSKNYRNFCDLVDIQSFADYYATQIYIGNKDWPNNNTQLWRCRKAETGNKYGDTKWRWMLFDTEYSMNLYSQTTNEFDSIEHAMSNDQLFRAVMENEDFQKLFVNTMMDIYNVNFDPDMANNRLNQYIEIYRPLMGDYYNRFGGGYSWNFDNNIARIQSFMDARRDNMLWYLNNHLYTGNAANVTITSSLKMKELITVNTTKPNMQSGLWTGLYFRKYPIVLKAKVPVGCQFEGWEVTGGTVDNASSTEATITLTSSSVAIRAKYTGTPVETPAPTPTPTSTPKPTLTPTPTSAPTQTPVQSPVPAQTSTPTHTPTQTHAPTHTPMQTLTPTQTPIPTPTKIITPGPEQTKKPAAAPVSTVREIKVPKAVISSITGKKKSLVLKIKKLSGVNGYQIVYTTDKKFKNAKKVLTTKKLSVTIKKLKSKKMYYIKVRAYKLNAKGKKVYGSYSTVKKKKVK